MTHIGRHPTIFSQDEMIQIFVNDSNGAVIASLSGVPHIGLVTLNVDENHRRKGHGERLLKEYIQIVTEKTKEESVRFECHKDNVKAMNLYKKLGFVFDESETTKDYYVVLCILALNR